MFSSIREWVDDRFGLGPLKKAVLDRRVARSPWYYGDGAALMLLLGVLVLTGSMMTLTYSPSPDSAYESVRYITEEQFLGWFIRALHYWTAGLMVVMLVWHILRQVLLGGYKFPREGTWLLGVALFFAVLTMSFTGYVLRWDERAIYALQVSLHMFSRVPLIGEHLVVFVQGGTETGSATLSRLYAVHVIFVPLMIVLFVVWHVYLVMVHGVTSRGERKKPVHSVEEQRRMYKEQAEDERAGETFHPETTAKSGTFATVVFLVAAGLAMLLGPAPLMPEANLVERSFPAEEWWWWWYSGLIALLPHWVAPWFVVAFPILLLVAMVLLPFLDRGPNRGLRRRPWAASFVALTVIALIALSGLRLRSPWTGWPNPDPPAVPPGFELTADAERGRQLFARYGCNSCHAVAGDGRRVAIDLATIRTPMSRDELREYILSPPENIAMPGYEGRVSEEDLERLVDYVLVAQTFLGEPEGR